MAIKTVVTGNQGPIMESSHVTGNQDPIPESSHAVGNQDSIPESPLKGAFMTTFYIYNRVTEVGLQTYLGAWMHLPSSLHFGEWEALAHTEEDT